MGPRAPEARPRRGQGAQGVNKGRVNKGRVNKALYKEDGLVIRGCYSEAFGGEGDLLGEKNWILLGKGCQDPSGPAREPRAPEAKRFVAAQGIVVRCALVTGSKYVKAEETDGRRHLKTEKQSLCFQVANHPGGFGGQSPQRGAQ